MNIYRLLSPSPPPPPPLPPQVYCTALRIKNDKAGVRQIGRNDSGFVHRLFLYHRRLTIVEDNRLSLEDRYTDRFVYARITSSGEVGQNRTIFGNRNRWGEIRVNRHVLRIETWELSIEIFYENLDSWSYMFWIFEYSEEILVWLNVSTGNSS